VFDVHSLIPDLTRLATLSFFATMTFGFAGLELAPIMGGEIKRPARTIPRAILISGVLIAGVYLVGTAVLLAALPRQTVDVISGIPQALTAVGERAGVPHLARIAALLITAGGIGGVGAWVAGTARLPFVVGVDRYLPTSLGRVHPRWGTPHVALLVQGVLCTVLLMMAAAGSTVEEAYVVLVDMTIVLYFIPFLYLFAALPVLRLRKVESGERVLPVPGGRFGVLLTAGLGLAATAISLFFAAVPPEDSERPWLFLIKVVGGSAALIGAGLLLYLLRRERS
jgi:amino acid transporter